MSPLRVNLHLIKHMMADAGLEWNEKKSKCAHLKRGKLYVEDITLDDGFKIKCLESFDLYKYLGVPECIIHDIPNLCKQLQKTISDRANINLVFSPIR